MSIFLDASRRTKIIYTWFTVIQPVDVKLLSPFFSFKALYFIDLACLHVSLDMSPFFPFCLDSPYIIYRLRKSIEWGPPWQMVLAGDSSKTNNPELIKIYISPRHFITSNWPRRSLYRKYCGILLYIVYPPTKRSISWDPGQIAVIWNILIWNY